MSHSTFSLKLVARLALCQTGRKEGFKALIQFLRLRALEVTEVIAIRNFVKALRRIVPGFVVGIAGLAVGLFIYLVGLEVVKVADLLVSKGC